MSGSVDANGTAGNVHSLFEAVRPGPENGKQPLPQQHAKPVLGVREAKIRAVPTLDSSYVAGQLLRTEPVLRPEKGRIGLDIGLRHLEQLLSGVEDQGSKHTSGGESAVQAGLPLI